MGSAITWQGRVVLGLLAPNAHSHCKWVLTPALSVVVAEAIPNLETLVLTNNRLSNLQVCLRASASTSLNWQHALEHALDFRGHLSILHIPPPKLDVCQSRFILQPQRHE